MCSSLRLLSLLPISSQQLLKPLWFLPQKTLKNPKFTESWRSFWQVCNSMRLCVGGKNFSVVGQLHMSLSRRGWVDWQLLKPPWFLPQKNLKNPKFTESWRFILQVGNSMRLCVGGQNFSVVGQLHMSLSRRGWVDWRDRLARASRASHYSVTTIWLNFYRLQYTWLKIRGNKLPLVAQKEAVSPVPLAPLTTSTVSMSVTTIGR